MAAFETPWIAEMTSSPARGSETAPGKSKEDPNPPTTAAFSPTSGTSSSPATRQRSTILVHRKSPLLVATPPTITRALAFSHPFLLPLNQIVGLITWTSGDPWESFLVVAGFWAITLYGDIITRYAGPLMVVVFVILGMYSRRYSPLSSSGWTGEKTKDPKEKSEGNMKHQKSLDEIVETLTLFTSRCNILLEPFMQLTDFLSTQRTATSATTRPALTTLFIRILLISPLWIGLTLPPLHILTTRRVILAVSTVMLSWHSRPARVTRTLLWRSRFIRRIVSVVTGLKFGNQPQVPLTPEKRAPPPLPPRYKSQQDVANSLTAHGQAESLGVRFTFVVFENQRRWLGLGWTYSLLAYERTAWTDEHLNPSDPKDSFQLPPVDNGTAEWRWAPGSEWQVEGGGKNRASNGVDGWIYYDNKWNDGRRGQDGWGRYTRRRKWYRDAELMETSSGTGLDGSTDTLVPPASGIAAIDAPPAYSQATKESDASSSQARRHGFFRKNSRTSAHSSADSSGSSTLRGDERDTQQLPSHQERDGYWGIGDDAKMGLE